MKRLVIMIPAFNEETTIGQVLIKLQKFTFPNLLIDCIVIDDGSTDGTNNEVAKRKIKVLRHILNRGLGGALGTGFAYAQKYKYDYGITFDADGQHAVEDIPRILTPLMAGNVDVVIGTRTQSAGMPLIRRIINVLSNIYTYILFGVWTTDSQSGFRGFTATAIKRLSIKSQGMEVSSEIFKEIKRLQLRYKEAPIHAIYTDYSLHKGQRISNAPKVIWKLILHKFI